MALCDTDGHNFQIIDYAPGLDVDGRSVPPHAMCTKCGKVISVRYVSEE